MKFSVTIPAYKAQFLKEAISSVLNQTYKDLELVIVDDCSPEDIVSIVKGFQDPRIRYFRNEKNCGAVNLVDNWNICLSHCIGEYVICMGDDDKLYPECLEEYVKLILKYPGLELYHAGAEVIDQDNRLISIQEPRPEYESALSFIINRWNGRSQYIGDFCYETKSLKERGGYFKMPLAWASDDITAARAAMKGGIANMQLTAFQYRHNAATITSCGNPELKFKAAILERDWYLELYKSINPNSLSIPDKKYHSIMEREILRHFHMQRKWCLVKGIDGNLLQLFKYIKHRRGWDVSCKLLLYYWIESLAHNK